MQNDEWRLQLIALLNSAFSILHSAFPLEFLVADKAAPDLKIRTKTFALRIIRLYQNLPKSGEAQVIGKQVLRSGKWHSPRRPFV